MSEEFKTLVDTSYDKGTPFWLHTKDYIFGMVPADNDRWIEVSYTFEDPDDPFIKTERNADLSFQFLLEEVEKGVSFYVEDLKVPLLKEFANSLEGSSGAEKMKKIITELINNSDKYSPNLPIIKSKDQINLLKEKV
ncbi:MAG: hypothetical protein ACW96X_06715 [Promethearchaeota archaeon]|jgi:hypothetical protein